MKKQAQCQNLIKKECQSEKIRQDNYNSEFEDKKNRINSFNLEKTQLQNKRFLELYQKLSQNQKVISKSKKKAKKKQIRSIFHNFQKHLVITLRQSIKKESFKQTHNYQLLAREMWLIFLNKKKVFTKSILHIIFGVQDYESCDISTIQNQGIIQKFGYLQIFSKNSDDLLTKAQQYLRFQVIRQLKPLTLKDMMGKRRVKKPEVLYAYIRQFLTELEIGPMWKRMSKTKKLELVGKNMNFV